MGSLRKTSIRGCFGLKCSGNYKLTRAFLTLLVFLLVTAAPAPAATHRSAQITLPGYVPDEIIVKFRKTIADAVEEQLNVQTSVGQLKLSNGLDELNARHRLREIKPLFKDFKKNRQQLKALQKKDKDLLTKKEERILRRLKRAPEGVKVPDLSRIYKIQVKLEPGLSLEEVVAAFNNDPDVEYAELNYIVSICAEPNDPLYPIQWPLNNTGQMYPESGYYNPPPGTADCDIDAPEAWDVHTGSSEVIVAVVDTGVDYGHRDLQGNMWVNSGEIPGNGVDDDGNGYIDDTCGYDFINGDADPKDDNGHGTHCAGTIAAEGNNGLDITGVCWNTKIMGLKSLNNFGEGTLAAAVEAFYYAVENGADVTSNSWGGGDHSETMEQAINYAHSQGVIMVAAAGNDGDTVPEYPAYYEHMIAVAATDSDDQKAPFSNYGDWVDIAAPGVDVLSLRASGTSMGTTYDDYTTIASGTSMACPHIAGACALLLSFNAALTCDEVYDVLMGTVDPITPGICLSDGRVNVFNAMLEAIPPKGFIILDHDYYTCSSTVGIWLADCDLAGVGSQEVTLTTNGGDFETVILTETVLACGLFTGTISTASGDANILDGTVQVADGQIICVIYYDYDDGTGNPAIATDIARTDCRAPAIFDVGIDVPGPEPTVTFETDEPTTARVLCGLSCSEPNDIIATDSTSATTHAIQLAGVLPETDYYFIIEATDTVGNTTVDDNDVQCYAFTTTGPEDVYVPSERPTIQEAIDISWDGGTVWVADGTYTGGGNRDIDFKGRAITVRSENGPNNCIIDCQGKETQRHRGFFFHNEEGELSILMGFTITHGYAPDDKGGGIRCIGSSPTIDNCIIEKNQAVYHGGFGPFGGHGLHCDDSSPTVTNTVINDNSGAYAAMYNINGSCPTLTNCKFSRNNGGGMRNYYSSSPTLTNCTFSGNFGANYGGGMYNNDNSNPILTNCTFTGNSANYRGGAMRNDSSNPTLTNCTFTGNSAPDDGGGMYNSNSSPILINCNFVNNSTGDDVDSDGGAMFNNYSSPTLINCTFIGNSAQRHGGAMLNHEQSSPTLVNCMFAGNSAGNDGGGMQNRSHSCPTLTNCTFSGNTASNEGGGIYSDDGYGLTLTNCILWSNSDNGGMDESAQIHGGSPVGINYCCVQGWTGSLGGVGNIGDDPLFVDADGADNVPGTEDDNLSLSEGSPCVDTADNDAVPPDTFDIDGDDNTEEPIPFDLHGDPRFTGSGTPPIVDMGAYEGPKNSFLLSTVSITVPEGGTSTFTVALVIEPLGTVQVTVARVSGDPDITVESGASLTFNSSNYSNPQPVTLAAAEDDDYFRSEAVIEVSAPGFITTRVTATEEDNEPVPAVLYVDANAPGANNGANWTDALGDLQEALSIAAAYHTEVEQIRVAHGFYTPAEPFGDTTVTFQLINGVAIKGGYAGYGEPDPNARDVDVYTTILSGDLNGNDEPDFVNYAENSDCVVTSTSTDETTVLDGFTITGGNGGGGMYNKQGSPTVINCMFIANKAYLGGGMHNYEASPTVTNCTFSGNWAKGESGGGMFSYKANLLTVTNCTFSGNSASASGGGMSTYQGSSTITDCTFIENSASGGGGGISSSGSSTVSNCTFSGNSGGMGGGISCGGTGSSTIVNCTISGNYAKGVGTSGFYGGGGGIHVTHNNEDSLTLINCTVVNNSTAKYGGGICCMLKGSLTVVNSILWDNTAGMGPQVALRYIKTFNWPSGITISYSDVEGGESEIYVEDPNCTLNWDAGNTDVDPLFVDADGPDNDPNTWQDNDYHLQSEAGRWDPNKNEWVTDADTSLCIDTGDPNSDWTAELWPHGKLINMGAYGGTPEAGMSLSSVGNAADLITDDAVNFRDFTRWADSWGIEEVLLAEDLDRNGRVDFNDLDIFAANWLWEE